MQLQRPLQDQLGHVGEPVADPHQRQTPGQIRHRDAKHRGPLEVAQLLHHALLVIGSPESPAMRSASSSASVRAIGRALEQALVDQFVEQQRMRGDLRGEEIAVRASSTSRAARARSRTSSAEVGGARADGLEQRRAAAAARVSASPPAAASPPARGSSGFEPPPSGLVEAPHRRRIAQIGEQARRRFGST